MCRDDGHLERYAKLAQHRRGILHDGQIGITAHDDTNQGVRHSFFVPKILISVLTRLAFSQAAIDRLIDDRDMPHLAPGLVTALP